LIFSEAMKIFFLSISESRKVQVNTFLATLYKLYLGKEKVLWSTKLTNLVFLSITLRIPLTCQLIIQSKQIIQSHFII